MRYVVDASVVLAHIMGEPGGEVLAGEDAEFLLSTVNLAEVLSKIADRGLSGDDVMRVLRRLPIEHVGHGVDDARDGAGLRARTRHAGLSLGDRACLALGARMALPVLTVDTAWAGLALGIDIRLIR